MTVIQFNLSLVFRNVFKAWHDPPSKQEIAEAINSTGKANHICARFPVMWSEWQHDTVCLEWPYTKCSWTTISLSSAVDSWPSLILFLNGCGDMMLLSLLSQLTWHQVDIFFFAVCKEPILQVMYYTYIYYLYIHGIRVIRDVLLLLPASCPLCVVTLFYVFIIYIRLRIAA